MEARERLKFVQQPYSKNRRIGRQMGLRRATRRLKEKMQNASKSRPVLHFRRWRIDRGVEQPGSSSVRPHIAKNQCVFAIRTAGVQQKSLVLIADQFRIVVR